MFAVTVLFPLMQDPETILFWLRHDTKYDGTAV